MHLPTQLTEAMGPMTQGTVVTDCGVQLLYQTFGQGPPIVFANGIGVRYWGGVKQIEALRRRHRIICWDYRGLGQSVVPDYRSTDVSIPRHAADILAILDHLEVEEALFVGWSMGSQVSLEVIRQQPARVAGLVALLGTCGHPFHNAFPGPLSAGVNLFFTTLNRHPQLVQGALSLAVALPRLTFEVLSRALFIGPDADQLAFGANVRSVAGADKVCYTRTMLELARHDASDLLERVGCPTLIIAAERDHLTPPRIARQMAARIPGADYREIAGGTHFALIEQPEKINAWLEAFAGRVLVDPPPAEQDLGGGRAIAR